MLKVKHDQYIFPRRSSDAIPRADTGIFKDMGWIAQLKYNDSHALVKFCPDGTIELWNRHAERFRTYHAPAELIEELRMIGERLGVTPGTVTILDGGVLDQKHAAIKDTIVLWDILVYNDDHLIGTTYDARYVQLIAAATQESWMFDQYDFGLQFTKNVFIPRNWEDWDAAWDMVHAANAPYTTGKPGDRDYDCKPVLEGLFFKNPLGKLQMGFKESNNSDWNMRSRVQTGRHRF
jgi:hypothetical protein